MSDNKVAAGDDEKWIDKSQPGSEHESEQTSQSVKDQSNGAAAKDDDRSLILPLNGQELQSSDSKKSKEKSSSLAFNSTVCDNNPLLKQLLFTDRSENDTSKEIIVLFPLETVSVLFDTEDKLKNDSRAYKCLMDKMFALAEFPKDHRAKIYTLLKFLMNNELASKISMFGTYSKLSFSSLKLYEILQKVMLKHIPELTVKNIQMSIQRWLYNASRRLLLKKVCSCEDSED